MKKVRAKLAFREVTKATWADFERLFESPGAPSYCWCMAWRATTEETKHTDRASRKAQMKARIDGGVPVGILAYDGREPVAWCSIAPRATYRRTLATPQPGDDDEQVWSVVCFYVRRDARKRGVMKQLLAAAKAHARARGATVLEAYPVDEDSPSYRYGGFVPMYADAGFVEVGRVGTRRHVVRLPLTPASRARR